MQRDHTAENIADELKAATDEWGITQKIVAVVTDNAANIVAAIRWNGCSMLCPYTEPDSTRCAKG